MGVAVSLSDLTLAPSLKLFEAVRNTVMMDFILLFCSRMRSEGFSFNSGGLEVGVVFAQRCSSDCSMFATVRSMFAMRSLGLTIGCDQDDVLKADFLANSPFVVFCDMR